MNLQISKAPAAVLKRSAKADYLRAGLQRLTQFNEELSEVKQALDAMADALGENSKKALERHRKKLSTFEPTVTVLGQVKSGKTALINAMVGRADLLPSDVNPWTSAVTSLHLKQSMQTEETSARFKFLSETEWDRLLDKGGRIGELSQRAGAESELQKIAEIIEDVRDRARRRLGERFEMLIGQEHEYGYFNKELLEKYICVGDSYIDEKRSECTTEKGRFADILRSADLFLSSGHLPFDLCIRDTPGVNDTFLMREQITIQAVRESRFCVVVLSASQALSSVDMGLIRLISNLKSRNIVVFVNRVDELAKPSEQIPEIENSVQTTLINRHGPEGLKIVFGSAAWANAVLTGDIEAMPAASARSLLNWAEASIDPQSTNADPNGIVWSLSGIPDLFRALSDQIVDEMGRPLLQQTSRSAISIASAQLAVRKIRRQDAEYSDLTQKQACDELEVITERRLSALEGDLDKAVAEYTARTDRAHRQFIERATQSLVSHLENYGPKDGWRYDPTGLRLLVRSSHYVLARRVQSLVKQHAEASVIDVAGLYSAAFGDAVEGVQMATPEPPNVPPPISLGQTIALDFSDGWWISWWRRMRGYDAFAKQFKLLIEGETEDFIRQLKRTHTDDIVARALSVLSGFFQDHRNILADIGPGVVEQNEMRELFLANDVHSRDANLEMIMDVLHSHANSERGK